MGGGERCSGTGATEPHAICVGSEDRGTRRGPGPRVPGAERRPPEQQTPAPTKTSVLEGSLFPGQHRLLLTLDFPGTPHRVLNSTPQVFEEGVSTRFRSVSFLQSRGPGLGGHLSAIQHGVMADLATVGCLLEHCVPPHYQLTAAYIKAIHRCLHHHLAQV